MASLLLSSLIIIIFFQTTLIQSSTPYQDYDQTNPTVENCRQSRLPFSSCSSSSSTPYRDYNDRTNPTVESCGQRLMPLASCSSFVQDMVSLPGQTCCDNFTQVYNQEFQCLCLVFGDPSFISAPINRTRALQLPILCGFDADGLFRCSGLPNNVTSSSPGFQHPTGKMTNSTNAASPTPAATPDPTTGLRGVPPGGSSVGTKLNAMNQLAPAFIAAMIFLRVLVIIFLV